MKLNVINYHDMIYIGITKTFCKTQNYDIMKIFGTIIIDECHCLGADTFKTILDNSNMSDKLIALSATPDRYD